MFAAFRIIDCLRLVTLCREDELSGYLFVCSSAQDVSRHNALLSSTRFQI